MQSRYNILTLGASYGLLLAAKVVAAGHSVKMACLPAEAQLINAEGVKVRLPVKGREGLVEIDTLALPGKLTADAPHAIDPNGFDLVVLAMQEPQYRSAGVRELLDAVARGRIPCMSIMNMPPLPYLARIPGVAVDKLRAAYTDPSVWDSFDPALMTLCSPDPQAFRPPGDKTNVLQVRLPTNFKAARFESDAHTAMLRQLEREIEAARFAAGDDRIELPVKLKVHDSVFVPLAKWSMLLAGNYRCVQADGIRSIHDAVHSDIARSRAVYDWVAGLCRSLGAADKDLVAFEKYANAALSLASPSSAARALAAGAKDIERVDRLVQTIAAERGMRCDELDQTVALVDRMLTANREQAGQAQ
ncbi:MAG: hypothetical protein ABI854_06245 [Betaproteobacteria bacterium]